MSFSPSRRACPLLQPTELDRPEAHPPQLHHPVADRLGHPPHLAVAPLAQDDLDLPLTNPLNLRRRRHPVLELHPALQPPQIGVGRRPPQLRPIRLAHPVARMRQPVGQLPVVREQDQPSRLGIEPPHRIEPRSRVDQFDHSRPSPWFPRRRDHPSRLVHRPDLPRLSPNQAPVHPHLISICDVPRRVRDHLPANPDPPLGDDHLSFTPRSDPSMSEKLGEPHDARGTGGGPDGASPLLLRRDLPRSRPPSWLGSLLPSLKQSLPQLPLILRRRIELATDRATHPTRRARRAARRAPSS